ncbi:FkbM family methyltransferase [Patulibacter sp. NPDC049589]|uniref:FkbM family methyltransferase n=1 Tax=Patulibacter sp. NPDC049589 TaxID=3154731 RepID=UPI00341E95D7
MSHIANLDEIWLLGEYRDIASRDADTVLDLGANVGCASLYLRSKFPHARIVAVEPDPANAELLRRNTRSADVHVVQAAIGAVPGVTSFEQSHESWGSRVGGDSSDSIVVSVVTPDSVLRAVGTDPNDTLVVKVDIEGSEWSLFESGPIFGSWNPVEIYGETHDWGAPDDQEQFWAEAGQRLGLTSVSLKDRVHLKRTTL